ncbi:MAG: uridine diphosphate-N-acetylglucosamine-binding protein YvcK [Actinobacteria bacterium]|uniref:Unannotated protein n=1 Tax=freshwater metagenome TaxID=449393 RepID=A0A6J5ZTD2_9ZZZZ|nr:uridine diphosphate-N-acetylglucosamine-binding protein YvcK [Actinomycetota bacterium]
MSGPSRAVDVVALGGGHGLAASLRALRRVTPHLTAVVGVSDDGGSSGRIREQLGVVPPGDLRMALAALCGDDEWGSTWARVLQHRFRSGGDLDGHSLGNLLITALWEETDDVVSGLDWVARLLDAHGTVLPLALEPLEISARVTTAAGDLETVVGQVKVATTPHDIESISLSPSNPKPCPQAVAAVLNTDVVVLGPGSWYTSVLTHFQVPAMFEALHNTPAKRVLVLNLRPQRGETSGYSPERYLDVLVSSHPDFRLDAVIADPTHVSDVAALHQVTDAMGAHLALMPVSAPGESSGVHDAELLASAFRSVFGHGSIGVWQ